MRIVEQAKREREEYKSLAAGTAEELESAYYMLDTRHEQLLVSQKATGDCPPPWTALLDLLGLVGIGAHPREIYSRGA